MVAGRAPFEQVCPPSEVTQCLVSAPSWWRQSGNVCCLVCEGFLCLSWGQLSFCINLFCQTMKNILFFFFFFTCHSKELFLSNYRVRELCDQSVLVWPAELRLEASSVNVFTQLFIVWSLVDSSFVSPNCRHDSSSSGIETFSYVLWSFFPWINLLNKIHTLLFWEKVYICQGV